MKVVDASVAAAILFSEPAQENLVARLRGRPLAAPLLLHFEVANVCLKKARARPLEYEALVEAFAALGDWEIILHGIDLTEAVSLARQHRLSAHDASYLWLARELDAELITLDQRLQSAYARMTSR